MLRPRNPKFTPVMRGTVLRPAQRPGAPTKNPDHANLFIQGTSGPKPKPSTMVQLNALATFLAEAEAKLKVPEYEKFIKAAPLHERENSPRSPGSSPRYSREASPTSAPKRPGPAPAPAGPQSAPAAAAEKPRPTDAHQLRTGAGRQSEGPQGADPRSFKPPLVPGVFPSLIPVIRGSSPLRRPTHAGADGAKPADLAIQLVEVVAVPDPAPSASKPGSSSTRERKGHLKSLKHVKYETAAAVEADYAELAARLGALGGLPLRPPTTGPGPLAMTPAQPTPGTSGAGPGDAGKPRRVGAGGRSRKPLLGSTVRVPRLAQGDASADGASLWASYPPLNPTPGPSETPTLPPLPRSVLRPRD